MIPEIAGLDTFAGTVFHSARWDHDHDLTDEDVAVIGIGASAIQFVPEVAKEAKTLTLFQRSSNYVAPKPDGEFSDRGPAPASSGSPGGSASTASRSGRGSISAGSCSARGRSWRSWARRSSSTELSEVVNDDLPAEALIPDYRLGCKRILISNDWYPTLLPAQREGGDRAGRRHHPDRRPCPMGPSTRPTRSSSAPGSPRPASSPPSGSPAAAEPTSTSEWRDGAEAHLGLTGPGFPNLFLLYGPNTNLGHNSIVFMIERQIAYALTLIRRLADDGPDAAASVEVTRRGPGRSNRAARAAAAPTPCGPSSCHSWYKTASGKITNNWSGTTTSYWWRTRRPRRGDFVRSGQPPVAGIRSARPFGARVLGIGSMRPVARIAAPHRPVDPGDQQ